VGLSAQDKEYLHFVQTIPMPNVKGRIDHMDVDVKGRRLFVAALENSSLEVVDLQTGKWLKSIPGFKKTQGIAYVPSLNKVFVASGDDGMVRVFRGDTLAPLDAIKLDLGPNRVACDPHTELLYVGYGGKDAGEDYGEVGIIDAKTDKHLGNVKVEAHPSELLLDQSGKTLFVFVSIASRVQVVDTKKREVVSTWPVSSQRNGDGALDEKKSADCLSEHARPRKSLSWILRTAGKSQISQPLKAWTESISMLDSSESIFPVVATTMLAMSSRTSRKMPIITKPSGKYQQNQVPAPRFGPLS